MSASRYVQLALISLLVVIITLNVAVPTINQAATSQTPVPALYILKAPFTYGTAYPLGHAPVVKGSVKVYNATYTAVLGSDYTIDYTNGTITVLSSGKLLNTSNYNVSYQYLAPVYTGTNLTLVHLTVLMIVLGVLVIVMATMLLRWL